MQKTSIVGLGVIFQSALSLFFGSMALAGGAKCNTTSGRTLCTYPGPQVCYIRNSNPRRCVVTLSGGLTTVTLTDTGETMRFDKYNSGTVEIMYENGDSEMGLIDYTYKVPDRIRIRTGSGSLYNLPN